MPLRFDPSPYLAAFQMGEQNRSGPEPETIVEPFMQGLQEWQKGKQYDALMKMKKEQQARERWQAFVDYGYTGDDNLPGMGNDGFTPNAYIGSGQTPPTLSPPMSSPIEGPPLPPTAQPSGISQPSGMTPPVGMPPPAGMPPSSGIPEPSGTPQRKPILKTVSPRPFLGMKREKALQAARDRERDFEIKEQNLEYNRQRLEDQLANSEMNRQKTQNELDKPRKARERMSGNISELGNLYKELLDVGAAIDTRNDPITNIFNSLRSSELGQTVEKSIGTRAQSIRNRILQLQPILLNDIRKATEQGARGLDSDRELSFYLQAVTDPRWDILANFQALQVLDRAYGLNMGVELPNIYGLDPGTLREYNGIQYQYMLGDPSDPRSWKTIEELQK